MRCLWGAAVMERSAKISECGRYRYSLHRRWAMGARLVWVMLNPSTADAETDDPTVRRCIGFARRDGWAGIVVVNLYGLIATDPKELLGAADPVGPENDYHLIRHASEGATVVAAWGANRLAVARVGVVVESACRRLVCLGVTRSGAPRHPLYVPADMRTASWVAP